MPVPAKRNDSPSHEILVGGKQLLCGDEITTRVIFNNLSGKNFERPSGLFASHSKYLAWMESEFEVSFRSGTAIERRLMGDCEPLDSIVL